MPNIVKIDPQIGFFSVDGSVLPEAITKHCKLSAAKYFTQGSIRFGSTTEYRGLENENLGESGFQAVSSDEKEGKSQFYFAPGKMKRHRIEGVMDVGHDSGVVVENARLTTDIHLLVYCASLGKHNRERHRKLICGHQQSDGTVFGPQPELRQYCEIPTLSFLRAIRDSLPINIREENEDQFLVMCGVVEYKKSEIVVPSSLGEEFHFDKRSHDRTYSGAFEKPGSFSHEEEFRIAIFPFGKETTPRDKLGFELRSQKLKRCLTKNFRVKPPTCNL